MAIFTIVPIRQLQYTKLDGKPALVILTMKILGIGERLAIIFIHVPFFPEPSVNHQLF